MRSIKLFEKLLEEKVKRYGMDVENFGIQLKLLKNYIKQIEDQYFEEYNKGNKANLELKGLFESIKYNGLKEFEETNVTIICFVDGFNNLYDQVCKVLEYKFNKDNIFYSLKAIEQINDKEAIVLTQNIIKKKEVPPFPYKKSFTSRVLSNVLKNLMSQFTFTPPSQPLKSIKQRIKRIDLNRNDKHYIISLNTITTPITATTPEAYAKELFERLENYFQIKKDYNLFILRFIYLLKKIASGNPLKIFDINLENIAKNVGNDKISDTILSDESTLAKKKDIYYIKITLLIQEVKHLYQANVIPYLGTTLFDEYINLRFSKGYSKFNVFRKELLARIFEIYFLLIIFANNMNGKLINLDLLKAIREYRDKNDYNSLTSNMLNLRNTIRHLTHFQNGEYVKVKLNNSTQYYNTIVRYSFNNFQLQVKVKRDNDVLFVYCDSIEKVYEYVDN
ncbi:hypothetical protein ABK040_003369 [Willaertia magna]